MDEKKRWRFSEGTEKTVHFDCHDYYGRVTVPEQTNRKAFVAAVLAMQGERDGLLEEVATLRGERDFWKAEVERRINSLWHPVTLGLVAGCVAVLILFLTGFFDW